jgi:hypothetical protein
VSSEKGKRDSLGVLVSWTDKANISSKLKKAMAMEIVMLQDLIVEDIVEDLGRQ